MTEDRFKFRAWHKKRKFMSPVWSIGFRAWDDESINYVEIEQDGTEKVAEHEVVLMQFTGISDENDVDVYEGDIVKGLLDYGPGGFHAIVAEVGFDLIFGYRWWYFYDHFGDEFIEVIGNIHEHPHLLAKTS